MKIPKGFLFALIMTITASILIGFSQENKKESTPQEKTITEKQEPAEKELKPQEEKKLEEKKSTPSEEAQEKYDEAELLRESQRNLDRSLSTLNIVATLMGVLVMVLTAIIIIAGGFGIFESRKWRVARRRLERSARSAERNAKIIEDIAQQDVSYINKDISKFPTLDFIEKISPELIEKLDEHSRRLDFVEQFGLPIKPEDYINRGFDLINKNKYEPALEAFEQAIELEPNSFRGWLGKGIVLDKQEKYDEALIACEKTIELKPEEAFTWNNKGVTLNNLERFEEALKPIEKALEIMPTYALAWVNKGKGLIKLKRYDESLEAHKKAVEIDSDIAVAWFNIACIYAIKKDKKNMLINLAKAVELDPKLKEEAKKDEDFKGYLEDKDFQKITN